jgi:phenylacetate-coenzyme A ligase PaaK-like adenylate-forming protein
VSVIDRIYERLPIPLQEWVCTYAGWRRARQRFTPQFHAMLRSLEASDRASTEELLEIQAKRLTRMLDRARTHVPHYRELDLPPMPTAGDAAVRIERALGEIPILEKQAYAADPESFIARDLSSRRLIVSKTSGTTGTALPLWWTPEAFAEEYAVLWRLYRRSGVEIPDPFFSFGGQAIVPVSQLEPPYWRTSRWRGQTLFSLYHMSPANIPAYVDALHEIPGDYAQGYPSSLYLVARALVEEGRPLPKGKLKVVLTSSESLLSFHRDTIEAGFGAPVADRYGTSELVVSMTGCAEHNFHVDMEFGIVEVEVEEEGEDWERGPLIVTGLSNDATPFLRYRVGDVGTRSKHPCPCGRSGQVFLDIDGRVEDYVVTPDGRWIGRLDHIFKGETAVAEAQILQESAESIEIRVVPRARFDDESLQSLLAETRSRLGDEIGIDVTLVDAIERESNGKFRAVKSKIGRNQA